MLFNFPGLSRSHEITLRTNQRKMSLFAIQDEDGSVYFSSKFAIEIVYHILLSITRQSIRQQIHRANEPLPCTRLAERDWTSGEDVKTVEQLL